MGVLQMAVDEREHHQQGYHTYIYKHIATLHQRADGGVEVKEILPTLELAPLEQDGQRHGAIDTHGHEPPPQRVGGEGLDDEIPLAVGGYEQPPHQ